MPVRTKDAIQSEIAALKAIKPKVRKASAFGDNHHDSIDAQIHVLEANLPESKIFDIYTPDEDGGDCQNVLDEALSARQWLDGESEFSGLAEQWEELVEA